LLSRFRPGRKKKEDEEKKRDREIEKLDEFLARRDYIGAVSALEVS